MVIFFCALWVLTVGLVLHAWVLMQLWAWFMVPIFGVNLLGLPHAMGIGLLVFFLTHSIKVEQRSN